MDPMSKGIHEIYWLEVGAAQGWMSPRYMRDLRCT